MSRKATVKTVEEVRRMRAAGLVVAEALRVVGEIIEPGLSAADIDAAVHEVIVGAGAKPSFLGYHGYPASTCVSIDEQVVHGIPRREAVLREGSLVSVDVGAIVDGWHGDAAATFAVGAVVAERAELSRVTEEALWAGIAAAVSGSRLGDIGAAVSGAVRAYDFGIGEGFTGHGIGTSMHEEPDVHNVPGEKGSRLRLEVGHVLAIEPMVTLGSPDVVEQDDGWTVITADGSVAAHWEHTVAITETGPWVLTALDGGAAHLGERVSVEAAS